MKIIYPDYNNCLVNLSNSILKHFNVEQSHNSLKEIDDILNEKKYKNVIILLHDGMGSNILKRDFKDSFLVKNKIKDLTSVFPATTTAATTSLETGLTPAEHCWLGWDIFIKDINKTVTMFLNTLKGTDEKVEKYSVCKKYFPYISIIDKINTNNNEVKAYQISPHGGINYSNQNPNEMYKKILELSKTDGRKFIYVYNNEPDHLMHDFGVSDYRVKDKINYINTKTLELSEKLQDTLLIITADHGHITAGEYIILEDYPLLNDMLIRETSLEPRATNFFVKPDYKDKFKAEFDNLFGDHFMLLSKDDIINKKLFGDGIVHPRFLSCIGDYIAIAISNKSIIDKKEDTLLKGLHAGLTEDELLIPLIVIKK